MTRDQAIRKVLACLRLSKSNNPNEAAAALRHAKALMLKYGLDESDALAAEIRDAEAKTGYRGGEAPKSLLVLGHLVAECYRCEFVISRRYSFSSGTTVFRFFGAGADAEIAAYAFTVLRRQLQVAKRKHTARIRKRVNREARGEEFAFGWLAEVRALLPSDAMPEDRAKAIELAIKQRVGETKPTTGKEVAKSGKSTWADREAGHHAGRTAHLHAGVSGEGQKQLERQ